MVTINITNQGSGTYFCFAALKTQKICPCLGTLGEGLIMTKYFLAAMVLLLPSTGIACSCIFEDLPLEESVSQSLSRVSSVVLAEAIHVKENEVRIPSDEPIAPGTDLGGDITQFEEIQTWKGVHGKSFHTKINTTCCMCGYSFKEGEAYLLYLSGPDEEGYYSTNSCSRTRPRYGAEEEIDVLNQLAPNKSINFAPTAPDS